MKMEETIFTFFEIIRILGKVLSNEVSLLFRFEGG